MAFRRRGVDRHRCRARLVVVDVDPRHDGDDTLNDLETEHGLLPDTVESVTGGGGRHIYLRMPDGSTYPRNDQTGITLGAGVDIR
ncbi:MAG: bifunctional DNA primase/polymerase [Ilumatobacteraceae bacterium]